MHTSTTTATHSTTHMAIDGMSDYEKLRLANIARNEAALAKLSIPTLPKAVSKKKPAKKRPRLAAEGSGRRSSRIAAAPRRSMKEANDPTQDDSDYEEDHQGGDDADTEESSSEEEDEQPRRQRRRAVSKPSQVPAQSAPAELPPVGEQTDVLKVELAKTGRSKCRGCFEPIDAGAPRVGMTAWIMGRQSMTWSHPQCCVNRLVVAVEATGRGKCKLTGSLLQKGTPKLGVRSHTATSWVTMAGAASVLAPVLRVVPAEERERVNAALGASGEPTVEGYADLSEEHAATVRSALQAACSSGVAADGGKVESSTPPPAEQSSAGGGKKLTGRVAWKFGGATCYGTMIPARETETHCYATTHKGNVKTLTKGKAYWWLLEKE